MRECWDLLVGSMGIGSEKSIGVMVCDIYSVLPGSNIISDHCVPGKHLAYVHTHMIVLDH